MAQKSAGVYWVAWLREVLDANFILIIRKANTISEQEDNVTFRVMSLGTAPFQLIGLDIGSVLVGSLFSYNS